MKDWQIITDENNIQHFLTPNGYKPKLIAKHIPIKYIVSHISDISAEDFTRLAWHQMPWDDKTKNFSCYYTFLNIQTFNK